MPGPTMQERVDDLGAAFGDAVNRLGRAAEAFSPAGAVSGSASAIFAIVRTLYRQIKDLVRWLRDLVVGLPEAFGELISGATETLIEEVGRILDDIQNLAGQALEAAIGAVFGFFEMIKKMVYLITDYIERNFPKNPLTSLVRLQLDLVNNLLGHLAEQMSPKLGQTARRLRLDMYDQLAAIRIAEGVAPRRRAVEEDEA